MEFVFVCDLQIASVCVRVCECESESKNTQLEYESGRGNCKGCMCAVCGVLSNELNQDFEFPIDVCCMLCAASIRFGVTSEKKIEKKKQIKFLIAFDRMQRL